MTEQGPCPRCGGERLMRTMTHYLCLTPYCRWNVEHDEPIRLSRSALNPTH